MLISSTQLNLSLLLLQTFCPIQIYQFQFFINQMNKPIVEVISMSPSDSRTIQKAGADRIQLVSALEIGGLSPSIGIIRKSLQCVDIPIMVMIRHHNNGFCHSQQEIQVFYDQIDYLKNIEVKGIVVGGVTSQNQVDENLIKQVNQLASNKMDWTFHKAIDQTNIIQSYQTLCKNFVPRVLTQGGKQSITQNCELLSQIIQKSKQNKDKDKNNVHIDFKTRVLIGGGVSGKNIQQILKYTKAEQIHVGTYVHKNKFQQVIFQKVQQLVHKANKAYESYSL